MFKCKGCGKVYAYEEDFTPSSDATIDERLVFDGKELRNQCPACGGLIYPMAEVEKRPGRVVLAA